MNRPPVLPRRQCRTIFSTMMLLNILQRFASVLPRISNFKKKKKKVRRREREINGSQFFLYKHTLRRERMNPTLRTDGLEHLCPL